MMKYTKPSYNNEAIESSDIVLATVLLEGGATLDVLGLR